MQPGNVAALLLKANAIAGLQDTDGAMQQIVEAIRLDPKDGRAYTAVGEVELQKGRDAEAEAAFKKAVELQPTSVSAHLSLANYYVSTGKPAAAEQPLRRAVELEPRQRRRATVTRHLLHGRRQERRGRSRAEGDRGDRAHHA